jgi:hypothetical protein
MLPSNRVLLMAMAPLVMIAGILWPKIWNLVSGHKAFHQ